MPRRANQHLVWTAKNRFVQALAMVALDVSTESLAASLAMLQRVDGKIEDLVVLQAGKVCMCRRASTDHKDPSLDRLRQ